MKSFIIKILLFITIPSLLYVVIGEFLKVEFRNDIGEYQTFVLGDSQTQFVKLPEIYNRSVEGSPYYVHYEFAKEFIEELRDKKIYIGCNYHNFSKLYQNRFVNEALLPGWREDTFRNIDEYYIFNRQHLDLRPKDLPYSFFDIKKVPRLFRKVYFPIKNRNSMVSVRNDTMAIKTTIYRHWRDPENVLSDVIQKSYLLKLIHLLKENNCEVILVKMPLTQYYIDNVPNEIKQITSLLSANYDVRLLDLNQSLQISKDYDYFKDYGHLNLKGDSLVLDYFKKNELIE